MDSLGGLGLAGTIALAPYLSRTNVYGPMLATPPAVLLVVGAATSSRILEPRFLRFTGRISDAVYLWHVPLFRLSGKTYARARDLTHAVPFGGEVRGAGPCRASRSACGAARRSRRRRAGSTSRCSPTRERGVAGSP